MTLFHLRAPLLCRWDVDSGDSVGATFEEEVATLNAVSTRDGHIVLNHDTLASTSEQLVPFLLQWAADRGLEMVTLGTCLGQPQATWYMDHVEPETRNPTWTCTSAQPEDTLTPSLRGGAVVDATNDGHHPVSMSG